LTPPPVAAPDSSLVHMLQTISRTSGRDCVFAGRVEQDGSWTLDLPAILKFLDRLAGSSSPILVPGTAFNFVHLMDCCAEKGRRLQLPAGSRILETGGYKGRSRTVAKLELHSLISEFFGVANSHIITEYGMSELSSQAYDAAVPLLERGSTTSDPLRAPDLLQRRRASIFRRGRGRR